METPQRRKTTRRVAHTDEKNIIHNIIRFCEEEKNQKRLLVPLERTTARVAQMVGKSEGTIKNIRKDFKRAEQTGEKVTTPRKKRKARKTISLDDFDKCIIRRKFLEYYEQKK